MKFSADTKINDLLNAYPFLEDFLASYESKFEMLRNKMTRATIGRIATVRTAAGIANIDLDALVAAIAAEIARHTGAFPEIGESTAPAQTRESRLAALKEVISDLHAGGDLEAARQKFAAAVEDVEATEIAAMEEELIRGGLPVSEVQRLCDVHVGAFREALDGHAELQAPPGHPVDTYMAANKVISTLANRLGEIARQVSGSGNAAAALSSAIGILDGLAGLENHYQRKENQLFPLLERYKVMGPSQVMWGVHDQIRAAMKKVRAAAVAGDAATFAADAPALARDIVEMIYKEEKILFPMAMQTFTDDEWAEVRHGEDELGYVLATPAAPFPAKRHVAAPAQVRLSGLAGLMTGDIDMEQLNLILCNLPVDVSFVDEADTVRFYSEGPDRIFPRSPAVIGRKVQFCHPPKSLNVVQDILDSFRAGRQSVAEFWLQLGPRFIHIRYFALRDKAGTYRGCLEVSQDVTGIRALQGERRLLEWKS
ncbi:MAG TPA: DUF438 domain-containing protein [Myxococcota bacterium]|nr:DUF438 domain-containing protein [Myxococcota bacterium]HOA13822.1 DUF438 domain-containing protein [Myxococcota bacterium]HOC98409.1 DUF438 domain-containing protein [Myxococcota bacterium]HOH76925.1 DUF438 domain-containing protein [Myxococcota bacterium]HPV03088.1 DUF438 domain-containing protein [Myxococcota bacterium]